MVSLLRFALLLLLITGVAWTKPPPTKVSTIADVLANDKILTRMDALVQGAGLQDFLAQKGPFTLFVPTDSAFVRFSPEQWDLLIRPENRPEMQRIVLFHLLNGKRLLERSIVTEGIFSCQGSILNLKKNGAGISIQGAKLVRSDIYCKNGVIQEIDSVLMPPGPALTPLPETPTPTPTPGPAPGADPPTPTPTPAPTFPPLPTPTPISIDAPQGTLPHPVPANLTPAIRTPAIEHSPTPAPAFRHA